MLDHIVGVKVDHGAAPPGRTAFPSSNFHAFLLFAWDSFGFFPTHLILCLPPILMLFDVMQAYFVASACPPVKERISPISSAGFPIVSESNFFYSYVISLIVPSKYMKSSF